MKGIKCSQCGLVYWSTDPNCRRCGLATEAEPAPSYDEPQDQYQYQQQNFTPAAPVYNYGEDAVTAKLLKDLKGGSIYFYIIGGLQILLWFVLGQLMIVDGVLNITLSFLVHKFRSRVAALCLMGITLLAIMATVAAFAAGEHSAMISPVGIIIRLWASIRMVKAAFQLHGYQPPSPAQVLPPPPPNFYPETAPQYAE